MVLDERGISLVETILAVVILFLITASLIPFTYQLRTTLQNKKLEMHASEVALNGALQMQYYGTSSGQEIIEQTIYQWVYQSGTICVQFQNSTKELEKCIQ